MLYFVQGNAKEVFEEFKSSLQNIGERAPGLVDKDLPRSYFLGTPEQAEIFIEQWQSMGDTDYYCQGDITAGNLFLHYSVNPFKREDESSHDYIAQFYRKDFAYLSANNEPCGLIFFTRKDDPSNWVMGLVKNTNLHPEDRTVIFLSSLDLIPEYKKKKSEINKSLVDPEQNPFITQIDSVFIQHLIKYILQEEAKPRYILFDKLLQISRFMSLSTKELLNESSVLDLLIKYKIRASFNLIDDLLTPDSRLIKAILELRLTEDERVNRNILQMAVVYYEAIQLEHSKHLLGNYALIETLGALLWDDIQIKLLPILIARSFDLRVIQEVLSLQEYYRSVYTLAEAGMIQDVVFLFGQEQKRNQLTYIDSLDNAECRKMCLIFWVKANFSMEELKKIVGAMQKNPMLASTLIALDATHTFSIENLKKLALDPKRPWIESILYNFSNHFESYAPDYTHFDQNELHTIGFTLSLLKDAEIIEHDLYRAVSQNDHKGEALRLFLPELATINNKNHRQQLIKFVYAGVEKEITIQNKDLLALDKEVVAKAQDLRERLFSVKQLQALSLSKEMIAFAGQADNPRSKRFRQITIHVEAQCERMSERLTSSNSSSTRDKAALWQKAVKQYRRTLHSIAYDGINHKGDHLPARLKHAESTILAIVDPKISSWLEKTLVIIANILITGLTLGIANDVKYRRTGNYWFFSQTAEGEKIRALDRAVLSVVEEFPRAIMTN